MDARAFLQAQLESGAWLLTEAARDLSDDEFFERLPHAGESADWLFGHLTVNEDWFLQKLTGSAPALAPELYAVYQLDFPQPTVAQGVLDRDDLIEAFTEQRARVTAALAQADTSTWDQPAPDGLPPIFPTVGAVWGILGTHQYWHIGQLMSIRTMLGRPAFDMSPHHDPTGVAVPDVPTQLILPTDGPRVPPRLPAEVSAYTRAEYDKAQQTWGIPNNLVRTMGNHPQLALTEVDYANSFIFLENAYEEIPKPGAPEGSTETVLFPSAGFIDRITKELVISVVSLKNRSRYSITHHTMIAWGAVSGLAAGNTPEEKAARAEALLLNLVDDAGQEAYQGVEYQGEPLYSEYQLAVLDLVSKVNRNAHVVSDAEFDRLRELMRAEARERIANSPLAQQFGSAGPDDAYVERWVDAALVELTWTAVHFSGLLNRWFTVLKVRDEEFDLGGGASFVDAYNANVPDSIKRRNNALLGPSGWGT